MSALAAQQAPEKCPDVKPSGVIRENLYAAAALLARRPFQATHAAQWGHLAALSEAAKSRQQGGNVPLYLPEHVLGRAQQGPFQYESLAVSGRHCTLSYTANAAGELNVFLSDSSSNGTFLNAVRVDKNGAPVRVQHGDIISLVAPPEAATAFAYVFVSHVGHKRKSASQDDLPGDATEGTWGTGPGTGTGTKIRRVGTGEQSLALSDFRSMQRANEELRVRLAAKERSVEELTAQLEADQLHHVKALKEACAGAEAELLARLRAAEEKMAQNAGEAAAAVAQLQAAQGEVVDLQQRLAVEAQSRSEREGAIERLNATLAEVQREVEEGRAERVREKEAAQADKDRAEALRAKLDEERQSSCEALQRERQLQTALEEQRSAAAAAAAASSAAEAQLQLKQQELKAAEEARLASESRCVCLEAEAAKHHKLRHDEQEQLQGAREKVMLREAQLRAFHASASEIAELQLKQQARMAGLIRTLEDENEPPADVSGGQRSAPVGGSTATRPLDGRATQEEVTSRGEGGGGAAETQVAVGNTQLEQAALMETQLLPPPQTLPLAGLESLPEGGGGGWGGRGGARWQRGGGGANAAGE